MLSLQVFLGSTGEVSSNTAFNVNAINGGASDDNTTNNSRLSVQLDNPPNYSSSISSISSDSDSWASSVNDVSDVSFTSASSTSDSSDASASPVQSTFPESTVFLLSSDEAPAVDQTSYEGNNSTNLDVSVGFADPMEAKQISGNSNPISPLVKLTGNNKENNFCDSSNCTTQSSLVFSSNDENISSRENVTNCTILDPDQRNKLHHLEESLPNNRCSKYIPKTHSSCTLHEQNNRIDAENLNTIRTNNSEKNSVAETVNNKAFESTSKMKSNLIISNLIPKSQTTDGLQQSVKSQFRSNGTAKQKTTLKLGENSNYKLAKENKSSSNKSPSVHQQCLYVNTFFNGDNATVYTEDNLITIDNSEDTRDDQHFVRELVDLHSKVSSQYLDSSESKSRTNFCISSRLNNQTFNGLETIPEADSISVSGDANEVDSLCYNSIADFDHLNSRGKHIMKVSDTIKPVDSLSSNNLESISETSNSSEHSLEGDQISIFSQDSLYSTDIDVELCESTESSIVSDEQHVLDSLTTIPEETELSSEPVVIRYASSPQSPLMNTVTVTTTTENTLADDSMMSAHSDSNSYDTSNVNNSNIKLILNGVPSKTNVFDNFSSNTTCQELSITSQISNGSETSNINQNSNGSFFGRVRKTYAPCTRNRKNRASFKNEMSPESGELPDSPIQDSCLGKDVSYFNNGSDIDILRGSSESEYGTHSVTFTRKLDSIKATLADNQLTVEDFASSSLRSKYYCLERLACSIMGKSVEHRYSADDCDYDDDSITEDVKIEAINVALVNRYFVKNNDSEATLIEVLGNTQIDAIEDSNKEFISHNFEETQCKNNFNEPRHPPSGVHTSRPSNLSLPPLTRLPSPENIYNGSNVRSFNSTKQSSNVSNSNRKIQLVYPIQQQKPNNNSMNITPSSTESRSHGRPSAQASRIIPPQPTRRAPEIPSRIHIGKKTTQVNINGCPSTKEQSKVIHINGENSATKCSGKSNRSSPTALRKSGINSPNNNLVGTKSVPARNILKPSIASLQVNKSCSSVDKKIPRITNTITSRSLVDSTSSINNGMNTPLSSTTLERKRSAGKSTTSGYVTYSSESFSGNWKGKTAVNGKLGKTTENSDDRASKLPMTGKIISSIGKKAGRQNKRPQTHDLEHSIVVSAHTAYREALIM